MGNKIAIVYAEEEEETVEELLGEEKDVERLTGGDVDDHGNISAPYKPDAKFAPEDIPAPNYEILEERDCAEVVNGIWISSFYSPSSVRFKALLNASSNDNTRPENFKGDYYEINVFPLVSFSVGWSEKVFLDTVDKAADYIHSCLESGKAPMLVYCSCGPDRTSCILIAYLMKHRKWTFDQAFQRMIDVNQDRNAKTALIQRNLIWALKLKYSTLIRT